MESTENDGFEMAATAVTGGDYPAPDADNPPPPVEKKKRGRGRPPIHGKYSAAKKTAAAPADTPAVSGPVMDPAQLGVAVEGALSALADVTRTSPPHKQESESIGKALAYGLERSEVVASESPWAPLMLAVGLYVLPRALEAASRYVEEREKQEAAKNAGSLRRVADGLSPDDSRDGRRADNSPPIPADNRAGAVAPVGA